MFYISPIQKKILRAPPDQTFEEEEVHVVVLELMCLGYNNNDGPHGST